MRLTIRDQPWQLKFQTDVPEYDGSKDLEGLCDHRDQTIYVRKDMRGKMRLEVLTHEILHAINPNMAEKKVSYTAWELAQCLWKLGYRV